MGSDIARADRKNQAERHAHRACNGDLRGHAWPLSGFAHGKGVLGGHCVGTCLATAWPLDPDPPTTPPRAQVTSWANGWASRTGWGCPRTPDRRRGWWRQGSQWGVVATRQQRGYTVGMGQLTKAIAAAIRASEQTPGAIAYGAGVARSQLSRLLSGERGLTADTIERLADYLGLRINIEPKGKTKKGR